MPKKDENLTYKESKKINARFLFDIFNIDYKMVINIGTKPEKKITLKWPFFGHKTGLRGDNLIYFGLNLYIHFTYLL